MSEENIQRVDIREDTYLEMLDKVNKFDKQKEVLDKIKEYVKNTEELYSVENYEEEGLMTPIKNIKELLEEIE